MNRILAALTVSWLCLIFLAPLPSQQALAANPGPLQWLKVNKPGPDGFQVVSPSDVSHIAVGPGVVYVLDSDNARVYRSLNGGIRWENVTGRLTGGGAVLPASGITIAPDAPGIVAVVTNAGHAVFISADGGITWANANVPGINGTIQTVAISGEYQVGNASYRDVGIGTADWGDALAQTTGQVWILRLGAQLTSWRNSALRVDPAQSQPGGEVSSLAFSPHYADDQTIVVLASTNSDVLTPALKNATFLCLGHRNFNSGAVTWNDPTLFPGYPANAIPEGDAPGLDRIVTGLVLQSSYNSAIPATRQLILFFDRQPTLVSDDLYRMNDTLLTRFSTPDGANANISSLSLQGGKLMVGMVDPSPVDLLSVPVHVTLNAFSPVVTWAVNSGRPSGQGNARVAWSSDGRVAYCGTGKNPVPPPPPPGPPDESAFSVSDDNGQSWIAMSLIDTDLTLQDVAVASSPFSLFLATVSSAGVESVWRSAGEPLEHLWGRVLILNFASDKIILRLSRGYEKDYTLYAAEVGGVQIWVTSNRGNSWKQRHALAPIVDVAAGDKNIVYVALPGGILSKSVNGALSWQSPAPICLPQINMLSLYDRDTILAGGVVGDVAVSEDGGASFARFLDGIGNSPVQVVGDSDFRRNGVIYAGTGNAIYRRSVSAGEWQLMESLPPERQVSGIVCQEDILYVAWSSAVGLGSGAERNLSPADNLFLLEFDTLQFGSSAARFDAGPTSLRSTSGSTAIDLWAIDTLGNNLMTYGDCLAPRAPVIQIPQSAPTQSVTAPAPVVQAPAASPSPPEASSPQDAPQLTLSGPGPERADKPLSVSPNTTSETKPEAPAPVTPVELPTVSEVQAEPAFASPWLLAAAAGVFGMLFFLLRRLSKRS